MHAQHGLARAERAADAAHEVVAVHEGLADGAGAWKGAACMTGGEDVLGLRPGRAERRAIRC